MGNYAHKILGGGMMALFFTLTSLDLNTHLHIITPSVRHDLQAKQSHTEATKVALANQPSATRKTHQAVSN